MRTEEGKITMQGSTETTADVRAQSNNMFVSFKHDERNKSPFPIPLINRVAAEQTNDIHGLICKQKPRSYTSSP
jgi:hypothetical protein